MSRGRERPTARVLLALAAAVAGCSPGHDRLATADGPETTGPEAAREPPIVQEPAERPRKRGAARRQSDRPPEIPSDALSVDPARLEPGLSFALVAPRAVGRRQRMPVVVRVVDAGGRVARGVSGRLRLAVAGEAEFDRRELWLRRGVGSLTATVTAGADFSLRLPGGSGRREVRLDAREPRRLAGQVGGNDLRWRRGERIEVTADLTVPAGETLVIEPGVTILSGEGVNLTIAGRLVADGTAEEPVLFLPANPDRPWGGLIHRGEARYRWVLFAGGGGDEAHRFGHSRSQAMLYAGPGASVELDHCALQDAPGKGLGGRGARLGMRDGLVTRTDMGGELIDSEVRIERSHFLDFPDRAVPYRDDDNDALYLHGVFRDEGSRRPSIVRDSVFIGGVDDGVDHNGALVEISGCWIEGFSHEGIAASAGGRVDVTDTAISRCEQAIEAGAGAPRVVADHVLLFDNQVGVRYGDSYRSRYAGTLTLRNSVLLGNRRQGVLNYLHSTRAPAPRGVEVHHTLIDDASWPAGNGNLHAGAELDARLLLAPHSPGRGSAEDGTDPGLRTGRPR